MTLCYRACRIDITWPTVQNHCNDEPTIKPKGVFLLQKGQTVCNLKFIHQMALYIIMLICIIIYESKPPKSLRIIVVSTRVNKPSDIFFIYDT